MLLQRKMAHYTHPTLLNTCDLPQCPPDAAAMIRFGKTCRRYVPGGWIGAWSDIVVLLRKPGKDGPCYVAY